MSALWHLLSILDRAGELARKSVAISIMKTIKHGPLGIRALRWANYTSRAGRWQATTHATAVAVTLCREEVSESLTAEEVGLEDEIQDVVGGQAEVDRAEDGYGEDEGYGERETDNYGLSFGGGLAHVHYDD
jgi:hypothetical protein